MKKIDLVLLCSTLALFIIPYFIQSQTYVYYPQADVDSLERILQNKTGVDRVNTLNLLASSLCSQDPERSLQYANEARSLAKALKYDKGLVEAIKYMGHVYLFQGDYPKTLTNYHEALEIAEEAGLIKNAIWLYYDIALTNFFARIYEKAVEWGELALHRYREYGENGLSLQERSDTIYMHASRITSECEIGIATNDTGMVEKGINAARDYLKFGKENKVYSTAEMTAFTYQVGYRYSLIGEYDSATVYYKRALAMHQEGRNTGGMKNRIYQFLASMQYSLGNIDSAMYYLQTALEWYNAKGFLFWSTSVSNSIGGIYFLKKDIKSAEKQYLMSEELFNEYLSTASLYRYETTKNFTAFGYEVWFPLPHLLYKEWMWEQGKNMYKALFTINKLKGNVNKALDYNIKYTDAKDTLQNLIKNREISELQLVYEGKSKDNEIENLSLENNLNKQTIRKQYYAGAAIGLGLISVVLMSIMLYRGRQKQKKLNAWLEEKVQERTIQLEEARTNLESAYTELQGLDQAKNNFLNLISHELRTPLNGIVGAAHVLKDSFGEDTEFGEFVDMLKFSVDRLEGFSSSALIITQLQVKDYNIPMESLDLNKLVEDCILDKQEEAKARSITIEPDFQPEAIKCEGNKNLLQKAITDIIDNAVKYSPEKGTVNISLKKDTDKVLILIKDSGKGFSSEALQNLYKPFGLGEKHYDTHVGLSLPGAKLIMQAHGGSVEVESGADGGSVVSLSLAV